MLEGPSPTSRPSLAAGLVSRGEGTRALGTKRLVQGHPATEWGSDVGS